ncbi:globin family protein [Candidatus Methylacidithermus pantelleriae]|uniref:Bacterial haemoglobin n=1 Tax=Candidatus Methylacidithermus pantelleriae TaxID=2744239 RepID=A0A8J2BN37_9BACT|nr:globin family protein [Candidatus Methylacidithermus pantelleriae]CAF0697975.1 Putative bacterial haemoglobin [Candidatus Methylacidithermus pantelleriae]
MTEDRKALVRQSWEWIEPNAQAAGELFYSVLFEMAPSVRPMFKTAISEQANKLMQAIGFVVKGMDRWDTVVPVLQDLGRRHVQYGVMPEHYDIVGEALLRTLEKGLGERFTPPVREAWTNAYQLVAGVMKEAAYPTS